MKSAKTTAMILAIAFAGLSTSMATPHIKTNDFARKAREARMEQRQEKMAAQSESTKQMSSIALYMETEKKNKPLNFHRRHKLGMLGK